ncbi:threonine synthase [Candidozyma duobushaemuli]|uniref:threonine synthase n=2 Tax=Candidozyma TaxID=3303203 RepID=A0ABX8IBB0_9ASCO|nr:threonine synthase [[Candida] duobushaemulonis]PVH14930.1 threonine synthase [[Candida] duobushaemulonis]QWU89995.1 hypothetical protein CA3LBN_004353 [[Candida] haemuloni]
MSSASYRSTRSASEKTLSFEDVVMTGLAHDGGLFVPSSIPSLDKSFIEDWKNLDFQQLAFKIMRLYISTTDIPDNDLSILIEKSYSTFRESEVTPLKTLDADKQIFLLELFHGPTYAFKDVALQFVGNLFEYFLEKRNKSVSDEINKHRITVVGATSGDTGSAAIYGLRGKKNVSVFILYPTGRVSPIQEEQMTTVEDSNVHTLSVKGTFDDCQDIVKQIFGDRDFDKKYSVGAVNSINWARILAQMTYYFYSYFQLMKSVGCSDRKKVRFVVPSGNFGDILAGFYAKSMGLPVDKLIIATNENDILDRFLKHGRYERSGEVKATYSPAMDILISSNFERLLWYYIRQNLTEQDDKEAGKILNSWMSQLKSDGSFTADASVVEQARSDFDSNRVSDEETIETIKNIYDAHPSKYVLDPHSAIGVKTSLSFAAKDAERNANYISLATAHPAKFAEVVDKALSAVESYSFERDVLPTELKALSTKKKRITLVDEVSVEKVKEIIVEKLGQ